MKELRWIALILTALTVLMGLQTYGVYQQKAALETALTQAESEMAQMRQSLSELSETSRVFNELWQQLTDGDGLLKWLK